MRTVLLCVAVLVTAVAPASATLGSVVASFPAPANYPIALARATNNHYMWVFTNVTPYRIWRINADTGAVYDSFSSLVGTYTRGLTYEWGGTLIIGCYLNDYILRCDCNDGEVLSSFPAYHDFYGGLALQCQAGGRYPTGLFTDDTSPRTIWRQHHTTGSIYSSFEPSTRVYDLAWDYENGLIWGGEYAANLVVGYNTNGSVVASFEAPANYPLGMCYYGEYLWMSTTLGTHRIWKVHCPAGLDGAYTNITPTSAGKIKAMFR